MKIDRDFKVVKKNGEVVLADGTKLHMTAPNYMYLQMLQGYVLDIVLVIDAFCEKHGLTYYLGEGTLLGAVRHNGFIPWDDDIDLFMPREDYEKFFDLAKNDLPEGYVVDTPETNPKHWTIFSHVEMTKAVPYVKDRLAGIALYNGPTVDIMPIDYVPDDRSAELEKRGKQIQTLRRVLWIKSGLHKHTWYKSIKRKLGLYLPLKIYSLFRSFESLHRQIESLMTLTNTPDSKYATVFSSLYSTKKETFKKEYFGEPRRVSFAGHMLPIPQYAEKILERVYGAYQYLPPFKGRKSKHHFAINEDLLAQIKDAEILDLIEEIKQLQLSEEIRVKRAQTELKCGILSKSEGEVLIDPFEKMRNNPIDPSNVEALLKEIDHLQSNSQVTGTKVAKENNSFPRKVISKLKSLCVRVFSKLKGIARKYKNQRTRTLLGRFVALPIEEKTIFFDAFSGLGILDSPRTLFRQMLARKEFQDYKFVWTVNDPSIAKYNLDEFADLDHVIYVKRFSKKYIKYLSISKYLICNSSVPMYFARRPEQIYLNTWHGVPSKVMGYERVGQRVNATENIERNFLNTTHMIGANHFTAERMFKKAYLLDGIYTGALLDEPLPRTDTVRNTTREESLKRLADVGITTDKKIIVYAPTWKGQLYNSVNIDLTDLKAAVRYLKEHINSDEYEVFLRVHYFVYRAILLDEEMRKICIPFTIDTSELLPAVDILISDYSSIFFDFLGTGRPILFYVPDLSDYAENRGLYIPMEEMPGPVSETLEGISEYINHIEKIKTDYAEKYNVMREWCCSKEDGNVANRVIDAIFFDKPIETISCVNQKKKVLIMADFKKPFLRQADLCEYFNNIDYNKYDITLLTENPKKGNQHEFLEGINENVRILVNNGNLNAGAKKIWKIYNGLMTEKITYAYAYDALNMEHEWHRLVGFSEFDRLILVQPTENLANWALLGYTAPIKEKIFIQNETIAPTIFESQSHLKNYNAIYSDFSNL